MGRISFIDSSLSYRLWRTNSFHKLQLILLERRIIIELLLKLVFIEFLFFQFVFFKLFN